MADDEAQRALGQTFDRAAEEYDAARPAYPPALVDDALDRGALGTGSSVLEIGCGTGKLTEMLVERGLRVDAVDPGPNMLAVARRRVGEAAAVTFHLGRFEDVDLGERRFDAVFSAAAFHWVDPAVGWRKVADHLEPAGMLALLGYVDLRDDRSGPTQDAFVELLQKHAPELTAGWKPFHELGELLAGAETRRENASEVWDWLLDGGLKRPALVAPEAAWLFEDVEVSHLARTTEETAGEWLELFRTLSIYHRLDAEQRTALEQDARRLLEQSGDTVRSPLAVVLMTARRTGRYAG
jgi:SAM-dependent methyltransferase